MKRRLPDQGGAARRRSRWLFPSDAFLSNRTPALYWLLALLVAGAGVSIGCGRSADPSGRVRASGTVTSGGGPLPSGSILFLPAGDGRGGGAVIQNGRYEVPAEQGLTPGRYAVEIRAGASSATEPGPGMMIDEITGAEVPVKPGSNRSRSLATPSLKSRPKPPVRLEADVTREGPNEFNFDLPL